MGDRKSSAIGGSDAKVMKSGVSKCTCLRSYRGGKRTGLINQIFIWSVLCDPMWSTGTRLFCTPRFYSSGSVNQKVEPEPFTESTPIASFKLSMMVLLIVFRNIRLLKYIDVDIHTFSIKEIQIGLLLNSVYICSYRDNY